MEADKESIFSFTIQPTTMQLWRFFVHYANDGVRKAVNVILVGGSLLILLVGRRELTVQQTLLLLFVVVLFLVWQPVMLYLKALTKVREMEKQPPLVLCFTEEGVVLFRGEEEGRISWQEIQRVEALGSMVIIYGDRVHASLIPKTAMGNQEEAFREMLRQKLPRWKRKGV